MAGMNNFMAIGKSAREVEISPLSNTEPAPLPSVLLLTLSCKDDAAICSCFAGIWAPCALKSWLAYPKSWTASFRLPSFSRGDRPCNPALRSVWFLGDRFAE